MLLLRLVAILVVIAIGVGIVLFLLSGNRKYLKFSLQLLKWAVIFALLLFALLVLERFVALV